MRRLIVTYVASRGDPTLEWDRSVLLDGDVAQAVARLKQEEGPELQVHGSGDLIQTLMRHALFADGTVPKALRLVDSKVSASGVVIGIYEPAGDIVTGSFALDAG